METFIHELDGWPDLRWKHAQVASPLAAARLEQGRLIGHLEALGFRGVLVKDAAGERSTSYSLKNPE